VRVFRERGGEGGTIGEGYKLSLGGESVETAGREGLLVVKVQKKGKHTECESGYMPKQNNPKTLLEIKEGLRGGGIKRSSCKGKKGHQRELRGWGRRVKSSMHGKAPVRGGGV